MFYLGTPRPTECRLPDGPGEVGAARQCVSEQGVVVRGPLRAAIYPALWVGLKSVHRFVFRNWSG